ncbi:MAG: peptidyl-prolyl cis-trans isomerase [Ignavibacteriae bacterium]|nr:peptidyl-prolyl cis-trans isomerase [Ignavibacteriota bacterium]
MNSHKNKFANPIVALIIGLFFLSCSDDKIPEDQIIAKVGNRIITVDEFKSSFEFSLKTLRLGSNPRKHYLDLMIKEMLIANEGYSKGYNKSKYVSDRVKNRTNNNLLESFYLKHVHAKVKIPEEKIVDALKKSSIKFRLLIYPTPSLQKAAEAYEQAQISNLGDFIDKQIDRLEVKNVKKENFETDWMDFMEMPPEMFASIQNLEIGKPSEPIPFNDGYAIFQVVEIKREAIKSDELKFGTKRKKMYARLHNVESDKIVHKLMDSLLTPLDIRVSNTTIDQMVKPLFEWIKNGIPKSGSMVKNLSQVTDTSKSYLKQLKKILPQKLYSSVNGITTVEDYFNYMNYHRKTIIESSDLNDLKNRLITEVGTMIKNNQFIEIAKSDGVLDSSNVKKDIELWEEKWTYDIFRDHIIQKISVTDDEMKNYFKFRWKELRISDIDTTRFYKYKNDVYNAILFEKHKKLLDKELEDLKKKYSVWINNDVLYKLKLNDGPKSLETSVLVVKNFTGEFLVPTVDTQWFYY